MMTQAEAIELQNQIQRFWEDEESPDMPPESHENVLCENIFLSTIKRRSDKRLTDDLPFKGNIILFLITQLLKALAEQPRCEWCSTLPVEQQTEHLSTLIF